MNIAQNGNPSARVRMPIRNDEASASIPIGAPVCLTLDGTEDGVAVILPSSSAAKTHAFAFGVALGTYAAGANGEAQVYGFCQKAVILQKTRAASSDDWSASTLSQGVILQVNTVHNAFFTSGGTQAASGFLPHAILAESTVGASSASGTGDTRTAITGYMKVFLRQM
jgi:hypothetical protein